MNAPPENEFAPAATEANFKQTNREKPERLHGATPDARVKHGGQAMSAHQYSLPIADHRTDDALRDHLADLIEQLNSETDPAQRVFLHVEIQDLRHALRAEGPS